MKNGWIFLVLLLTSALHAVPWLGLVFRQETFQKQTVLKVESVHPDADAKQVRPGDLIVEINGTKVTDMAAVKKSLAGLKTGATVLLQLIRNGKRLSVKVKMTERPDDVSQMTGSSIGNKFVAFQKNYYRNAEKSQKKPKARLLDFWATWCGPCRQTLPILARLYQKYESQGLEIVGVSCESQDVLEKFYQEHPSPYPLYRDATQELSRTYRISSIPTLILLDENGYIQKIWPGVPHESSLDKAIREVLK
ncbi:redoxin domain-containing protein [Fibrobacter sp. UWS1]|uniref:redoxin domain-containing protein n=1 Tax=Fibrobacter sp. UWS1 TaxID=1896220 RepID=UPI000BB13B44|nr:redoxin domain-containing protein [Fibrobacter sp. UWS1]PBC67305.1 thiol-disulfide isomerase/thioredoxin [Fibrobacter sp. UWS1]